MSDKRDGMVETALSTVKAAAGKGISKVAIIGFVGALLVFAICSAPFFVAVWWWNKAPTATERKVAPLIQPLNAPELCKADERLGWYDGPQGRVYFCTPKVER